MKLKSNLLDIEVIYQTTTAKAVCIRETEDAPDVWLPLSEVEVEPDEPRRGQAVTLTGPDWLLQEKGLI